MPYRSNNRISDLLLQRGDIAARGAEARGNAWAGAVQNIGQIAQGSLGSLINYQADAPRRELEQIQLGQARTGVAANQQLTAENQQIGRLLQAAVTPEGTVDRAKFMAGMKELNLGHRLAEITAQLDKVDPPRQLEQRDPTKDLYDKRSGEVVMPGTPAPKDLMNVPVGGAVLDPETRQPVFTNPRPPEAPSNPTEASLAAEAAGGGPNAANAARALSLLRAQRPTPQGPQSPIPVIGPDGQPVYVRPSEALGRRPATTREQGRPVTSVDAGRIAEFDTSLDDLAVLRSTISDSGSTGTIAKVGASLPNWATELTGWTGPKEKQGVIDRVKQVIGKALEGGVLRKEDEYKYTKILPTIGDVPEVVEAKLAGLEQAIMLRRQRAIESLADANYDVTKFNERARPAAPAPAATADPLGIR